MDNGQYIAIDFETANEMRESACAVGIAAVSGGQIIERQSWLIKPPEMRFNPINISIHGISPTDVQDAPTFGELWPLLRSHIEGRAVIAHNAAFDMGVLGGTLDAYEIPYPDFGYSCTWAIARNVWPRLPNYKLHVVAAHLGVEFKHHDAADDAMAAAKIAIHACNETGSSSLRELISALNIKHRRFS